jgi:hypothetical protein
MQFIVIFIRSPSITSRDLIMRSRWPNYLSPFFEDQNRFSQPPFYPFSCSISGLKTNLSYANPIASRSALAIEVTIPTSYSFDCLISQPIDLSCFRLHSRSVVNIFTLLCFLAFLGSFKNRGDNWSLSSPLLPGLYYTPAFFAHFSQLSSFRDFLRLRWLCHSSIPSTSSSTFCDSNLALPRLSLTFLNSSWTDLIFLDLPIRPRPSIDVIRQRHSLKKSRVLMRRYPWMASEGIIAVSEEK